LYRFFGGMYAEKTLLALQTCEHSECAAAGRSLLKKGALFKAPFLKYF